MADLKERVIANYARSIPRDLAPEYSATELYTSGRAEYENAILSRLSAKFLEYGVTLDDFTLRDVNFEDAYESAIEAQQIARERIETENYNAQAAVFEAQKVIEQAKGEAERTRIQAQADADALRIKAEAIRNNPQMLQLEFIQALKTANWMMIPWEQVQGFLPLPTP